MDAQRLRSQHDQELFDQLLKDRDVIRVNDRIAKQNEKVILECAGICYPHLFV